MISLTPWGTKLLRARQASAARAEPFLIKADLLRRMLAKGSELSVQTRCCPTSSIRCIQVAMLATVQLLRYRIKALVREAQQVFGRTMATITIVSSNRS